MEFIKVRGEERWDGRRVEAGGTSAGVGLIKGMCRILRWGIFEEWGVI